MSPEVCQACGAAIIFRNHERTGNRAPIDVTPVLGGSLMLVGDDLYQVIPKPEIERLIAEGLHSRTPHYATCPKGEQFRKRR